MSDPTSFASRTHLLRDGENAGDVATLEVVRLLEYLARNGADITSGDIRIRKGYNANYLRDELHVAWDKR